MAQPSDDARQFPSRYFALHGLARPATRSLWQGLASNSDGHRGKPIQEALMRKLLAISVAVILVLFTSTTVTVVAQATSRATGIEIRSSVKNDTSPTLQSLKSSLSKIRPLLERRVHPSPQLNPKRLSPKFHQPTTDDALQLSAGPVVPVTVIASVDGLGRGAPDTNGEPMPITSVPPDTNGSVGETQFVQTVNAYFAVFDKTDLIKSGTRSATPVRPVFGWTPINVIWRGFGGKCEANNDGDPIVAYDRIAKRWVITQMSYTGNGYAECIAVSTTSDATGAYYRYEFDQPSFNDYPKMGVWPDGYYITYNMFNGPEGARICAYERAQMLTGGPAREVAVQLSDSFWSLLPADFDGPTDEQHLPPQGSPCYFLSLGSNKNSLDFWKFHVDWAQPVESKFGDGNGGPDNVINVAPFADAPSRCPAIPQLGTAQKLETLGERLLYRLAYRRFAGHESLVTNHSIQARSIAAPRWYEIRDPGTVPVVAQQGTFSPDSTSRWIGSVAMDGRGNIGLGYSVSSKRIHPGIRVAAQMFGGPSGKLGTEQVILTSSSSQEGDGAERWGDYSSMIIDPVDDSTFWFTTEYLAGSQNSSFSWSTRIVAFKVGK